MYTYIKYAVPPTY